MRRLPSWALGLIAALLSPFVYLAVTHLWMDVIGNILANDPNWFDHDYAWIVMSAQDTKYMPVIKYIIGASIGTAFVDWGCSKKEIKFNLIVLMFAYLARCIIRSTEWEFIEKIAVCLGVLRYEVLSMVLLAAYFIIIGFVQLGITYYNATFGAPPPAQR